MGFGKFTISLLLVIVLGALAVMALPGGNTSPTPPLTWEHPWKRFASGTEGFEVPPGWLAYDPFTRVAAESAVGGCRHVPPLGCRAAYLRSPGQRVELFLAYGPARTLRSLLPVLEREKSALVATLVDSALTAGGVPMRWRSWDPTRTWDSFDSASKICLIGSARSGENLFLVHITGRPEPEDLEAIAALLASLRLPES